MPFLEVSSQCCKVPCLLLSDGFPVDCVLKLILIARTPWSYSTWSTTLSLAIFLPPSVGYNAILTVPQGKFPPVLWSPLSETLFLCGTLLFHGVWLQCLVSKHPLPLHTSLMYTALSFLPAFKIIQLFGYTFILFIVFIWSVFTVTAPE